MLVKYKEDYVNLNLIVLLRKEFVETDEYGRKSPYPYLIKFTTATAKGMYIFYEFKTEKQRDDAFSQITKVWGKEETFIEIE